MSSRPFRGKGRPFWRGGFNRGRGASRGRGRGRGKPDPQSGAQQGEQFSKRSRTRSRSKSRSPEAKKPSIEKRDDTLQKKEAPVQNHESLGPDESIRITIGNDRYRDDKEGNASGGGRREERSQPKNDKPSGNGGVNRMPFRGRGRGRADTFGPRTSMALSRRSPPRRYSRSPGRRRSYSRSPPRRRSRSPKRRVRRSRSRSHGRRYSRSRSRDRRWSRSRSRDRRSRSRSRDRRSRSRSTGYRSRSPDNRRNKDSSSRSKSSSRSPSPEPKKVQAPPAMSKVSINPGSLQKTMLNIIPEMPRFAARPDFIDRIMPPSALKGSANEPDKGFGKFAPQGKVSPRSMTIFDDLDSPRLRDSPEKASRLGDMIGLPQTRKVGKPLFPVIAPSVITERESSPGSERGRDEGLPNVAKQDDWEDQDHDIDERRTRIVSAGSGERRVKPISLIPGLGDIKDVEDEELFLYGDDDDGPPSSAALRESSLSSKSPPREVRKVAAERHTREDMYDPFGEKRSVGVDEPPKRFEDALDSELRKYRGQSSESSNREPPSRAPDYYSRDFDREERDDRFKKEYSRSPRRDYYDKESPKRDIRPDPSRRPRVYEDEVSTESFERNPRGISESEQQRFSRERSADSRERDSMARNLSVDRRNSEADGDSQTRNKSVERQESEEDKNVNLGKDPTFRNILQSIGFNFELSELMQKKGQKGRDEQLKSSLEAKINKTSSFLQAGIKELMNEATTEKKPKKVKMDNKESYEERARRYREQQMKAYEQGGKSPPPFEGQETAPPVPVTQFDPNTYAQAAPAVPVVPVVPVVSAVPAAGDQVYSQYQAHDPYNMHQQAMYSNPAAYSMEGYAFDPYASQMNDPFCMDYPSMSDQQAGAQRTSNLRVIETVAPEPLPPPPKSNLKTINTEDISETTTVITDASSRNSNRTVLLPKSEKQPVVEKKTIRIIKKESSKEPEGGVTPKEREKLLREQLERQKKLQALVGELEQLRKLQNELMRKKQRMKDGHKDPMLLENSKLQLEIERQIAKLRRAAEENETKGSEPHKKKKAATSDDTKPENSKSNFPEVKLREERKMKISYEYYDPGNHWCSHCNIVLSNVYDYFSHISSRKHKLKLDPYKRPWMPESLKNVPPKAKKQQTVLESVKGVEFMISTESYWCDLCKVFSGDQACAEHHLKSLEHNQRYQSYIIEHPFYEKSLTLEKAAKLSLQDHEESEMPESPVKKEVKREVKMEEEISDRPEKSDRNERSERKERYREERQERQKEERQREERKERQRESRENTETRSIRLTDDDQQNPNVSEQVSKRQRPAFMSPVSPERFASKEKYRSSETSRPAELPPDKSAMERAGFGKIHIKIPPVRKPDHSTEIDNSKISIKLSGKMLKTANPLENYPPRPAPKVAAQMPNFMIKKLKPVQTKPPPPSGPPLPPLPPSKPATVTKTVTQAVEKPPVVEETVMDPKEIAEMRLLGIEPDFGNTIKAKPPPSMASSQIKPRTSMATTSASGLFDIFFANQSNNPQERREEDAGSDGSDDINLGDFEIIDECSAKK